MRVLRLLAAGALAAALAGCGGSSPHPAPVKGSGGEWVDEPVTFRSAGMTIYGTFRHPSNRSVRVPAALLIVGSGPGDRNSNETSAPHLDTMRNVAGQLSADGVASLRYDKLGTGQTGLGPYAGRLADIDFQVYAQEAADALTYLAGQPGVRADRVAIAGHSEGGLFALLLASGAAGRLPPVHDLMLLEPLSLRYLNLLTNQLTAAVQKQQAAGQITATQAQQALDALSSIVSRLRATGTVAPDGPFQTVLNPTSAKFLYQADRYDPAVLAAHLPAGTRVLVTCSDADIQVFCTDTDRVVQGAARAGITADAVRLTGVDHVLKEDPSRTADQYNDPLPFSHQVATALRGFLTG